MLPPTKSYLLNLHKHAIWGLRIQIHEPKRDIVIQTIMFLPPQTRHVLSILENKKCIQKGKVL